MANRIVLKFGSGILTLAERPDLDHLQLELLVRAVAQLHFSGHECVIVTSGAVAAGLPAFGLKERPSELKILQACAAVGQTRLMHFYEEQFRRKSLNVAQLLLTHDDLKTPERRSNFQNTLECLLSFRNTVPVINENDSVAVEELKYGDNDLLSADVAGLINANMLILLTSVDGLYPPGKTLSGKILDRVEDIESVMGFATTEKGSLSVGGMSSKLRAVKRAVESGVEAIIANGRRPENLADLAAGQGLGTRFRAKPARSLHPNS